ELTSKVREMHQANPSLQTSEYVQALRLQLTEILTQYPSHLAHSQENQRPQIFLILGVNGNGKTTSVAKLANLFQQNGKKVLVAAADTFRAAAIEQLETWAHRIQADIVKGAPNSDPAAVAFDAIQAAKARQCDVVLIDTA